MSVWLFVVIAFVSALILGPIAGLIVGKVHVKRLQSSRGPVVSRKEGLILLSVALLGAVLIIATIISLVNQSKSPVMQDPNIGFDQPFIDMGGGHDMGGAQVMPGPSARGEMVVEEMAPADETVTEEPLADEEDAFTETAPETEQATQSAQNNLQAATGNVRIYGGAGGSGSATAIIVRRAG